MLIGHQLLPKQPFDFRNFDRDKLLDILVIAVEQKLEVAAERLCYVLCEQNVEILERWLFSVLDEDDLVFQMLI